MEFNKLNHSKTQLMKIWAETQSLVVPLAEFALDQVMNEGALRDIPIINSFVQLYKLKNNYSNHLLEKKLYDYFRNLDDIPFEKRIKFAQKYLNNDPTFSDNLLLAIDKSERLEKTPIFANLTRAFVYEKISKVDFWRLVKCLNDGFYEDFEFLKKYSHEKKLYGNEAQSLVNSGLVQIFTGLASPAFEMNGKFGLQGLSNRHSAYSITNIGKLFVKHGLHDEYFLPNS